MRKNIILFIGVIGLASTALGWSLHDISILFPLPTLSDDSATLSPSTSGSAGPLLPNQILSLLPPLVSGVSPNQLRVVAIRIDPCFPAIPAVPRDCHAQIRFVWQPLNWVNGETIASDAAVHSFYEISKDEFRELLNRIPQSSLNIPLGVHPLFLKQGYRGAFWTQLRAIILEYTGEKRLSRMTFMTQEQPNQMWDFGGVEVSPGRLQKIVIPRISTRLQSFVNKAGALFNFLGGEKPEPQGNDTFNRLLTHSADLTRGDAPLLKQSVDAIYRIENPTIHNPQTIDCVSCHIAQATRVWVTTHFPDLNLDKSEFRFTSPLDLTNTSSFQNLTVNLRAFGYFGRKPAISQRTINESAALVEKLNPH